MVAGLLINAASHPAQEAALRAKLRKVLPGLGYPPPGWYLRNPTPAARLVAYHRCTDTLGREAIRSKCQPAFDEIRGSKWNFARTLFDDDTGPDAPAKKEIQICNDWLRFNVPERYRILRDLVARDLRNLRGLLAGLRGVLGGDRAFVVGAVETRYSDKTEVPESSPSALHDPAVRLIGELEERVLMLLRQEGATSRQAVWVITADRGVRRPKTEGLTRMAVTDLGHAGKWASEIPYLRPTSEVSDSVRFARTFAPKRFDEEIHPGVVLANFVADQLREGMDDATSVRPWSFLVKRAETTFALPIEAVARSLPEAGPLPAVSCSGEPRRVLIRAIRREPFDASLLTPWWGRDQAVRWIEALGLGGAS